MKRQFIEECRYVSWWRARTCKVEAVQRGPAPGPAARASPGSRSSRRRAGTRPARFHVRKVLSERHWARGRDPLLASLCRACRSFETSRSERRPPRAAGPVASAKCPAQASSSSPWAPFEPEGEHRAAGPVAVPAHAFPYRVGLGRRGGHRRGVRSGKEPAIASRGVRDPKRERPAPGRHAPSSGQSVPRDELAAGSRRAPRGHRRSARYSNVEASAQDRLSASRGARRAAGGAAVRKRPARRKRSVRR